MGKLIFPTLISKYVLRKSSVFILLGVNQYSKQCLCSLGFLLLSSFALQANTAFHQKPLGVGTPLQVGAASLKITPPVGSVMGNSYGLSISEGVHDDLFAKALVFDVGGVKGAFLALDLISIPYGIVVQTRELIANKTEILMENVILTATHCHAGPQMNPRFLKAIGGEAEKKSLEYLKQLPEKLLNAIQMAEVSLQPAKASIGTFHEDKVNFNRRFLMKDGSAIVSEVQVMGLGDALVLVGFPGDAFVELSLAIRLKSPFTNTIVCEQSGNGNLSYVPDRKAFLEGGYEVNSARFSPGGGELLVDAVQQLLIDLYYH